jgi:hypothetical protein
MAFEQQEIRLGEFRHYVPFSYKGEVCVMVEIGPSSVFLKRLMKSGSLGQLREIRKEAFHTEDCLTIQDRYSVRMVKYQGGLKPNNLQ